MREREQGLTPAPGHPTGAARDAHRGEGDGRRDDDAGSLELDVAALYRDSEAWYRVYSGASAQLRAVVEQVTRRHVGDLATLFYRELLADPQARPLLSPHAVSSRLHGSLQRWMVALFSVEDEQAIPPVIDLQFTVGEVHARIGVPVPIVLRGARLLKAGLAGYVRGDGSLERDDLFAALRYIDGLIDLAMEVMSAAYLTNTKRAARTDEAYRLFSLGQDASMERERQRAALMEWAQGVLLDLYYTDRRGALPTLRASEFGLWMYHKGRAIFDGMPELAPLMRSIGEIDASVLPRLTAAPAQGAQEREAVEMLNQRVADVKFLLSALFERISAVDAGRDPLTQLLNRRFLPSVLAREVALATRSQCGFGVLLIDIDHFKQVNDTYGHDGGDVILRQAAELLQHVTRTSDYLFRYGGEEFLVLAVDTDFDALTVAASRVRAAFADHEFRLADGTSLPITASVGAAVFDGHPDPERIVTRADRALYAAKTGGRNRYVIDGGGDLRTEGL